MNTHIKLAYRQVIHQQSAETFERDVFKDSYSEFLMQVQAYNRENNFKTLAEVIAANPKAQSLHYKTGFAIGLYIKTLNNQAPGLRDSMDRANLPFETHQFELVSSDITDPSAHVVAITYTTGIFTLLGSFGEFLLLAPGALSGTDAEAGVETFMVKLRDDLSVVHYQQS